MRDDASRSALTTRTWVAICELALVGQVAWSLENNFFNLYLQDTFAGSLSDVALMVGISAIVATASTLVAGAITDRAGRRKPLVVCGMLAWGLSIAAFSLLRPLSRSLAGDAASAAPIGVALTILLDCVMSLFGSAANDASFNAWLTDVTDEPNRGQVEGVNSAMPLLGTLVAFGASMPFLVVGDTGAVTYRYGAFFALIGALVFASGLLAIPTMDEARPRRRRDDSSSWLAQLVNGFRPQVVIEHRMLYLVLAAFCTFAVAMQVYMPYLVLYLRLPYVLGERYTQVLAPCMLIAAAFAIALGKRIDERGFSSTIMLPLALSVVGCLSLASSASPPVVFLGSALMLSGYLGAFACLGTAVRNNTPPGHVGLYQGVRILMVVLVPMLVGPWIGSAVSSSSATIGLGVVGDDFTPSSLVFAAGAAVHLATLLPLALIRRLERG